MTTVKDIRTRHFESHHAIEQRRKAQKERRELLDEGISQEAHISLGNRGKWPEGSVYYWALSAVYGPVGSADQQRKAS